MSIARLSLLSSPFLLTMLNQLIYTQMLSTDWTKSLHLQADRSLSLHTQSGLHHTLRLPTYGRCIAYHSPSTDAIVGCTGSLVYRLNLEEGRFMTPLQVGMRDGGMMGNVDGVNCVDVNPRHGLWSFGLDGVDRGHVEFWDPRSRSTLTSLTLPTSSLLPSSGISTSTSSSTVSITSLQSHPTDGLSLAVGTSTGHTLLYDMRSSRPFAVKDLGYGEKVRDVHWLIGEGGEGKVMSSDTKVVKVWEKNDVSSRGGILTFEEIN
jgi:ribosome biogenesis protein ENP2